MSQTNNNSATATTSFSWLGLLGVIFVVAKVADGAGYENPVGDWSWWLVLLPFYFGFLVIIAILLLAAVGTGAFTVIDHYMSKRRRKKKQKLVQARLDEQKARREANTRRYDGP